MAGRAPQRHGVSAGVRDRGRRLHPAAAVIQARLAAPRRAMRVTGLVLAAALVRAVLLPAGDLLSTAVFGACLLAISVGEAGPRDERRWGRGRAAVAGLLVGAVLLAPVV